MMKPYYSDDHVVIYHGDCRQILADLPRADLVLTDPPYGISYDAAQSKHLWKSNYGFTAEWDKEAFDPAPVLALDLPTIMWGGNNYASRLPDKGGWVCWIKINTALAMNASTCRHADMELAWANCIGRGRVFHHVWTGCSRTGEGQTPSLHPTQKPIALMKWCIGLVKGVRSVIDPYMGSGSTLRAAKDLGLKAIGIELEEKYCEIAARRMAQQVLPLEPVSTAPEQMTIPA